MKKKVLFVLNQMGAGGIAKSLNNLLDNLEKFTGDYDFDLFLLRKDGCYINDVPKFVNIIEAKKLLKYYGASQRDTKKFGKFQYFTRFCIASWTKILSNHIPLRVGVRQNKLKQKYDIAISFTHTQNKFDMAAGSAEMVLWGVNAKKKYCFVHGDVLAEHLLTKSNINKLSKFDKIFCVSESCANQLKQNCKKLVEKCDYIYNTQNNREVIEKSNKEEILFDNRKLNLIMVSRLSAEKAHLRFLNVVKKLKDEGFDFYLHIVGDGIMKSDINAKILELGLNDQVIMHGYQTNPFSYVKQSDLFVLASYNEAAPMVYNEAMILGVPVFTTRVLSADEMIGNNGFVCDNDEQSIYDGLKNVLLNPQLLKEKKKLLKEWTYNNDVIVGKLINFFE